MHFTILIPRWYKINIVKRIWRRKVMGVTTGYHTVSNRQSCEWLSKRDSRSFYLQIIRAQQGIITNILLLTSRVKNWCQVFFQMTATQHHCEAVWNFLSFFYQKGSEPEASMTGVWHKKLSLRVVKLTPNLNKKKTYLPELTSKLFFEDMNLLEPVIKNRKHARGT